MRRDDTEYNIEKKKKQIRRFSFGISRRLERKRFFPGSPTRDGRGFREGWGSRPRAETFLGWKSPEALLAAERFPQSVSIERRRHTRARDWWRVSVEFERAESYTHARHVYHARAPVRLLERPLPTARASRRFGVRRSAFVRRRRISLEPISRRGPTPRRPAELGCRVSPPALRLALNPSPSLPRPRATAGRSPRTPPRARCPTSAACPLIPSTTARRTR